MIRRIGRLLEDREHTRTRVPEHVLEHPVCLQEVKYLSARYALLQECNPACNVDPS